MKWLTLVLALTLPSTVRASEPWMYPVSVEAPSSIEAIRSMSQTETYVDHLGVRILDSVSGTIHTKVASFSEIAKWYSDKLGGTDLPKALAAYDKRADDSPSTRDGYATGLPKQPTALIRYRLTPTHKQVTILPPAEHGDTVVVSLLATKNETSIQVVRRHANDRIK